MIQDKKIAWNRKRVFFHAHQMAGMLADSSLGNSTPTLVELTVTGAEIIGLPFDDEDEVYHYWPIPWDFDRFQPLRFRVWFVHASTDADTPAFQIDYKAIGKQDAVVDAKAATDEAVAIAAHTCSETDNSLEVTAWAESNSDDYLASTDFLLLLALEMTDLGGSTGDECEILGFELDYTVAAAPGAFRRQTRDAVASPSGPNF